MADCDNLLNKYNETIKLDDEREEFLRTSRDALGDKIKKHFSDKKLLTPSFKGQGSFTMKTTINPKTESDQYDIDYGVYINRDNIINEKGEWKNPSTAHSWVKDAVAGHTKEPPQDKNKCIRVNYQPTSDGYKYHVDLPIYVENKDKCYLAIKNDEKWEESNPRAIIDWFRKEINEENKGEQLRRIIRYLKSWSSNQTWNCQKPTGLIFTVLTSEYFVGAEGSDDVSLVETSKNIVDFLKDRKEKQQSCPLENPINNDEDLLEGYSDTALDKFIEKLEKFIEKGEKALAEKEVKKAYDEWCKALPDISSIPYDEVFKSLAPAILGNDNRSA